MSRNLFSQDGKIKQVDFALELIDKSNSCVGIIYKNGIIFASSAKDKTNLESISENYYFALEKNIICIASGNLPDANILLPYLKTFVDEYKFIFQETLPIEKLADYLSDLMHKPTQLIYQRPLGVSFIIGGWDEFKGFQLFKIDPSGNYSGWKATSIGYNNIINQTIIDEFYHKEIDIKDSIGIITRLFFKNLNDLNFSKSFNLVNLFFDENKNLLIKKLNKKELEKFKKIY